MLTPDQVRALRPGQLVTFTYSHGAVQDGKVLSNGPLGVRIEWDETSLIPWRSVYPYNATQWAQIDLRRELSPLQTEVCDILRACGLGETIIGYIMLEIARGEIERLADIQWIDALARGRAP